MWYYYFKILMNEKYIDLIFNLVVKITIKYVYNLLSLLFWKHILLSQKWVYQKKEELAIQRYELTEFQAKKKRKSTNFVINSVCTIFPVFVFSKDKYKINCITWFPRKRKLHNSFIKIWSTMWIKQFFFFFLIHWAREFLKIS